MLFGPAVLARTAGFFCLYGGGSLFYASHIRIPEGVLLNLTEGIL